MTDAEIPANLFNDITIKPKDGLLLTTRFEEYLAEVIQRAKQRGCVEQEYEMIKSRKKWFKQGLLRGAEIAEDHSLSETSISIAESIRKEANNERYKV